MHTETITFDKTKFKALKKAHQLAIDRKQDSFKFDDKEFDTLYAKYMIEYLEPKFKNK